MEIPFDIAPSFVLQLKNFGISFGSETHANLVLSNVDLSLDKSGIDVLMGPVKSGKSTLCRTLAGVYDGHALHRHWGDALLQGTPIRNGHRPVLLQQHARLLDAPIWQVLKQPSQGQIQRSQTEWRAWAGEQLQTHRLKNVATVVDRPLFDAPPAVQRAIMALALLLSGAPLLLLDEPTYGLKDDQSQQLLNWLKAIGQQHKLLVVLHNQQQARYLADSIVLIGGGRLLAHQSTTDFFTHPANSWVEQFLQTGSLSLPSLNATPKELESPPELLASAPAPEPAPPHPISPPNPIPIPAPKLVVEPAAPAPPVAALPVMLPLPSKQGVEMASMVGQVILSDSRGPQGFRWVVPGVLAGCPQPGVVAPMDYDLMLLERAGITHLITLTEQDMDQGALQRFGLRNTHLSIFDRKAPSTSQMHMLLVRMERLIDAGEVLAVHCKAGLGRTGLVLAAWMIRDGGLSAEATLERLRKIHPGYVQSDEQLAFLHTYEADILRRIR